MQYGTLAAATAPQLPFNSFVARPPPRPPAPASTGAAAAGMTMTMRPPASMGGFGDRVGGLTATPVAVGAAERDGIETVTVTNVVSAAPAINKIGSLFNSLNRTVTGALNSIIAGAPVAPANGIGGGSQTRPVSTALSPLPAWRVPRQQQQRPPLDVFSDHVQLQRFPQPPSSLPQHHPVLRTVSYEQQQQQQSQSVSYGAYWPPFDAQPSYQRVPAPVDQPSVRVPADWYGQLTPQLAAPVTSAAAHGDAQTRVDQRPPATASALVTAPGPSAVLPRTHPSAFSRVDPAAAVPGRGDWRQSLPDVDQRSGGQGPPSPVYSNASSTCFVPPTDWTSNRFAFAQPIPPPTHFPST